ncbi:cytochrome c biogenesis protein ResB [Neobacillus sp. YIM B02564]|uniref:Cytochrome c biogenesis protein ResB n=1 Tax=Neobacillus paridis TaxID=2803862 RepID=A0ABS1TRL9_9BACI|nr:cytochrome c biogenesis protein ResB [Neobacillus paridis]MBL4953937.1 cytochrome c biogenesis protein ResB [Neobacillus paridis]
MVAAKEIYRIISSMKTGLCLLVLIGLVSAVGSMVFPGGFFNTFVFKLLLLLLLLNMMLCTINRVVFFKKSNFFKRKIGKGLIRQIGVLLLHSGIVLILIGGVVYSFYGQSEQIEILSGETTNLAYAMVMDKPISLKLNDFKIETNHDGTPSQYYSDLSVIEGGKTQRKQVISVNHPLKYKHIKAYQDSYGYAVRSRAVTNTDNGQEQLLYEGESLTIPGSKRTVKIYRYFPDFDPTKGMAQNSMKQGDARVVYSVYENKKLLGVGAAKFGSKIEIDDHKYVVFDGVEPFTVLKVKSDPGLIFVLIGSLMFMLGVSMALIYMPARKKQNQLQQNTAVV